MSNYILVAVALLPAIVLCTYVYKKDRREKEPLILLFVLAISVTQGDGSVVRSFWFYLNMNLTSKKLCI